MVKTSAANPSPPTAAAWDAIRTDTRVTRGAFSACSNTTAPSASRSSRPCSARRTFAPQSLHRGNTTLNRHGTTLSPRLPPRHSRPLPQGDWLAPRAGEMRRPRTPRPGCRRLVGFRQSLLLPALAEVFDAGKAGGVFRESLPADALLLALEHRGRSERKERNRVLHSANLMAGVLGKQSRHPSPADC